MEGQKSLYDFEIENLNPPELWKCMKSCENNGKYIDRFPTGGKRCLYGIHKKGTTGDDTYSKTEQDGTVHIFCKYYKPK